jgi:predicted amidohydrolase
MLAKAGAEILSIPSAFTETTGRAHWEVLLRARAIENGCFIIAPAQGGKHANGRSTFGHSLIVGPWGDILAEAGTDPGFVTADIDLEEVAAVRARVPSLQHDRPFSAPRHGI